MYNIAVIGAGAWGTALANIYSQNGFKTLIWALEEDVVKSINSNRTNRYLPGIQLDQGVTATSNINECLDIEIVFLTIPSKYLPDIISQMKRGAVDSSQTLVICSKGIEAKSLKLPSEIVTELLPYNSILALAGPNLASEVAKGINSAASLAGSPADGLSLANKLSLPSFRLQYINDLIGSQVFSAVKNVVAIAAGMLQGSSYGENTVAEIVCRGIQEASKLAVAKGGYSTTAVEMCGMGDMVLTCYSSKSRNTSLGIEIASGNSLEQIISSKQTVSEGVETAAAIYRLAQSLQVDMPVCRAVYEVLHCGTSLQKALVTLL